MRQIGVAERLLDRGDRLDRRLEPILAELAVPDVLESLAHLAQLLVGERLAPGREDDRILARGMVGVHDDVAFEGARHHFGIAGRALAGHGADVFGDLAATVVLRDERIVERRRRALGLAQGRKHIGLLEHALVEILAEIAEQLRRLPQQLRVELAAAAQLRRALAINQEHAPQHAVLAHQLLDRTDLLFRRRRWRLGFLFGGKSGARAAGHENDAGKAGDQAAPAGIGQIDHNPPHRAKRSVTFLDRNQYRYLNAR